MPSVVKHTYVRTGGDGQARAKAHLRYIQFRKGDREFERGEASERGRREMFDDQRNNLDRREVGKLIDQARPGDVALHKLILSPGVPGVDLKEYAREVMGELSASKGQDLRWAACIHRNTEHDHMHVAVLGRDKRGDRVNISRADHDLLRYKGDKILEREHVIDREFEREVKDVERVIKERGLDNPRQRLDKVLGKKCAERPEREIKPAHEPERAEEKVSGREWTKEKAIESQPEWAKIQANDKEYTKFNSSKELKELDDYLNKARQNYVSKKQYAMMHRWLTEKREHGEKWHAEEDRKRLEKYGWWHGHEEKLGREREGRDELGRERPGQEKPERHDAGGLKPPRKRSSGGRRYAKYVSHREYERRGRDSVHDLYVQNMAKQRLIEAAIRNPELKATFDKELIQLNEFRRETRAKVEPIDLDRLIGGRKDRHRDRVEPQKPFGLKDVTYEDPLKPEPPKPKSERTEPEPDAGLKLGDIKFESPLGAESKKDTAGKQAERKKEPEQLPGRETDTPDQKTDQKPNDEKQTETKGKEKAEREKSPEEQKLEQLEQERLSREEEQIRLEKERLVKLEQQQKADEKLHKKQDREMKKEYKKGHKQENRMTDDEIDKEDQEEEARERGDDWDER